MDREISNMRYEIEAKERPRTNILGVEYFDKDDMKKARKLRSDVVKKQLMLDVNKEDEKFIKEIRKQDRKLSKNIGQIMDRAFRHAKKGEQIEF